MAATKLRQVQCQWYQSETTVTASFKLRSLETRGEVTAQFSTNHCAVYDGGELYWKAYLPNPITPNQCKLTTSKTRAEVTLRKGSRIKWEEFKVEPPVKNAESALDRPSSSSLPVSTGNKYVTEDLLFVEHLHHDFYDQNTSIKVKVLVGCVVEKSCKVSFSETSIEVKFQTRSEKFLKRFVDHSKNTFFIWKIKLFGEIVVGESSFKVLPKHVEVSLKKTSSKRWNTLSAPPLRRLVQHSTPGPREEGPKSTNDVLHQHSTPEEGEGPKSTNDLSDLAATHEEEEKVVSTLNAMELTNGVSRAEDLAGSNWNDIDAGLSKDTQTVFTDNLIPTESVSATHPSLRIIGSTNSVDAEVAMPADARPAHLIRSMSSSTSGYSTNTFDTSSNERGLEPSTLTSTLTSTFNNLDVNNITTSPSPSTSSSSTAANEVGANHRDHPTTGDLDHSHSNSPSLPTKPCFTGLLNIGNSCYMNSVVQCLSNTETLRNYFITRHFSSDINRRNPLGFKGQLATCFFEALQNLWSGDLEYFSLKRLKTVVASRGQHFAGYQQHDSHEFMSYLLDGLHEDLNRVQDKPVTAPLETSGIPDATLAEKAWQVHRLRNDSYFVDNFQGQFKSTLVCPVCQKVSVTFDPFMSLSVPIPQNLRHLPIYFVAQDPSKPPRLFVLKLPPDANLELLRASVARKTGISMLQLRIFEIFNNKFHNFLADNQQPIKSIKEGDNIIVSEVLSGGKEEVVEINMIQRLRVPIFPTKCADCSRHSDGIKKMQRCGKCRAVGYCNRSCQRHDWEEHKMKCRKGRPTPVGLPFVVSVATSHFTYSHLASMAEKFARRSVEVDIDNIQAENTEELLSQENPMYLFVPVDRYGDNEEDAEPLKDLGDVVLSFRGQYLAMDWQNTEHKGEGSVQVRPKQGLDHEVGGDSQQTLSRTVTLDQCIELFTQPETLSKEEAWYCSVCKEHREATKQISIWRLPPVLIIHLKRFSYSGHTHKHKLKEMVDFPLRNLDMTPFMLGEACPSLVPDGPPLYDLYATVNHDGAVYMGHYIAQVKPSSQHHHDNTRWLLYDDDRVKPIREDEVVDSTAYLLFYRHVHRRRRK